MLSMRFLADRYRSPAGPTPGAGVVVDCHARLEPHHQAVHDLSRTDDDDVTIGCGPEGIEVDRSASDDRETGQSTLAGGKPERRAPRRRQPDLPPTLGQHRWEGDADGDFDGLGEWVALIVNWRPSST